MKLTYGCSQSLLMINLWWN